MKKLMLAMTAALLLSSCGKEEFEMPRGGTQLTVDTDSIEPLVTITFAFSEAFMLQSMDDAVTRSTSLAQSDMTDLWLFDYVEGACVNTIHLTPSDDGWSAPSASFTLGAHDIYFVASRGSGAVVDQEAGTIVWTTVRDTFNGHLSLNVNSGTSPNQTVTLSRTVARLKVNVNDAVPDGISKLVIKPNDWYYGLNYVTGAAIESRNDDISINVPSSYIGTTGLFLSCFSIAGSDQWQTSFSVKALDGDENVLGHVNIANATFIKNISTEYSGMLFGGHSTMDVSLGDAWGETNTQTW
jgi:hypothetical protein